MEEFKTIVEFAAIIGGISSVLVQKFKESFTFKNAKWYTLVSLIVNMTIGVLISHRFGGYTWENATWVGGIAFVGADLLYKVLNATNVMASASELTAANTTVTPTVTPTAEGTDADAQG